MKKGNRKIIWRFIYIAVTIGIICLVGVIDPNLVSVVDALDRLNLKWVALSLTGILIYWIADALIIKHMAHYVSGGLAFRKSLKVAIIGQYYSAVTPSSTGGQPMQVLYLKRDGVAVGTATCMMCIKFICYLSALCTYIILGYALRGAYIYETANQAFWLTMLGFVVNLAGILFVFFVFINKSFVLKAANWIVRFLNKIHIVKNYEKMLGEARNLVDEFQSSLSIIKKNKLHVLGTYLISVMQMASMYSVACFLFMASGQYGGNLLDLFILQSFLFTTVSLFPAPGSAGASEGGFYLFMQPYFPPDMIFVIMVMWRFVTYYSNIIVGSAVVITDEVRMMRKEKREDRERARARRQ